MPLFRTELNLTCQVMIKVAVSNCIETTDSRQVKLQPDLTDALRKLLDSLLQLISSPEILDRLDCKLALARAQLPLYCTNTSFGHVLNENKKTPNALLMILNLIIAGIND